MKFSFINLHSIPCDNKAKTTACWLHQTLTLSTHWGNLHVSMKKVGVTSKSEAMVLYWKMVFLLLLSWELLPQMLRSLPFDICSSPHLDGHELTDQNNETVAGMNFLHRVAGPALTEIKRGNIQSEFGAELLLLHTAGRQLRWLYNTGYQDTT